MLCGGQEREAVLYSKEQTIQIIYGFDRVNQETVQCSHPKRKYDKWANPNKQEKY